MEKEKVIDFQSLTENVGRFNLSNKICLIPEMNKIGSHLLAAVFRGFGINAKIMDKYRGVSFRWLQGYLDLLALKLNNKQTWLSILLSTDIRT
jgi:hypothetical protein